MKLVAITLLIVLSGSGYAQMRMKAADIPDYLFADNAPFIVNFTTPIDVYKKTGSGGIGSTTTVRRTLEVEDFDPASLESQDDHLLMRIFQLCLKEFAGLGLKPSGYIELDMAVMLSDPDKVKQDLGNALNESKPQFMFIVMLPRDLSKAKKALLKGKFNLDLVEPVAITISKMGANVFADGQIQLPYMINKTNMSLADGFKQLKKDIDNKPANYFIKSLASNEVVDVTVSEEELSKAANTWTTGESLKQWPSDLLETTLVVYDGQRLSYELRGKDVTSTFIYKKLSKEYPGKFITTGFTDLTEYSKGPEHKYAMLVQTTKMVKQISTYTNGTGMTTKSKEKIEAYFFFYLKDLKTQQNYYTSLGKEDLEENAAIRLVSLKYFMKVMKEHYKWE